MVFGITGLDEIKFKKRNPLFIKIILSIFIFLFIYLFYKLNEKYYLIQ